MKGDQILDMNQSDFQRATGGKKVKFTFSIVLINGRPATIDGSSAPANGLMEVLLRDDTTSELLKDKEFEFTLNGNFQLIIKSPTALQSLNVPDHEAGVEEKSIDLPEEK